MPLNENRGASTLQWSKIVVTNIVFQNSATFNFHQADIKRSFHKLYSKVVQLPNNAIVKGNYIF
jgi:hypothetical protein